MKLWKHFLHSVVLTILILSLVSIFLFLKLTGLGERLYIEDVLSPAEYIIVISGGGNERIEKGVELYKEGFAPLLVLTGSAKYSKLSNAESMSLYAITHGVPEENILLEHFAQNTLENALFVKDLLKNIPKSMILVTTSYHQRRAFETFASVFPETKILNSPAQVSFWEKESWWKNRKSFFLSISEDLKLFWGKITGRWG